MERQSSRYVWIAYPQAYTCYSLPIPRVRYEPYALRSSRLPYERKGGGVSLPPFFPSLDRKTKPRLFYRDAAHLLPRRGTPRRYKGRQLFCCDAAHLSSRRGTPRRYKSRCACQDPTIG